MGRKGNWFSAVKKAFSPTSKEKKLQGSKDEKLPRSASDYIQETKFIEAVDEEQTKHAYSESNCHASKSGLEISNLSAESQYASKPKEEMAAVKIQTAYRGYMSRRALRALRGLVRLRSIVQGPLAMRQVMNTVQQMQMLTHLQSQIRSRRVRMLEESQFLQRQFLQKHPQELGVVQNAEEWDDSQKSKEQIETKLMSKQEAAMRRERALAYAFTHQQTLRNSSNVPNSMFIPPGNLSWGWSWLERWTSAKQWETPSAAGKQPGTHMLLKSRRRRLDTGEINARCQIDSDKSFPSPTLRLSSPNQLVTPQAGSTFKHLKSDITRRSTGGPEDDLMSILSLQSAKHRRHSTAGSLSVQDFESLGCTISLVPSYMVPTKSAMARSRRRSLLRDVEGNATPDDVMTQASGEKQRSSYPART